MQTQSARKQFKPEVRSKRNEDRHKQSGKTSEDPGMDPTGSVEIPSDTEDNIAPRRPPYIPPLRTGVKPPRRNKQFTINTPSLPPGVQLVGTMTGKIDRLKYADHDTSDCENFPQFTPGTYLHFFKYDETRATILEVKRWAAGLDQAGLLKMLDVPHFGHGTQVTIVFK